MNSTKDIIANRDFFNQLSHVWFSYRLGLSCLRNDAGYFRWNSHAGSEETASSIGAWMPLSITTPPYLRTPLGVLR